MTSKRVILVTGANSGIGLDTSYALAAASADHHVIMGCRSVAKGEGALRQLQARKPAGTLSLLQLDITSDESIAQAVAAIESSHGRLDWLVNNAGVTVRDAQSRRAELLDTYNTNAVGAVLVTEALLPLLRRSASPGGARVVNVSSTLGSVAGRFDAAAVHAREPWQAYRMSKAALNMATGCLLAAHGQAAAEEPGSDKGSKGVRFWAYCPGYVVTNLTGEGDRQRRVDTGAESAETSAQGVLEILQGQRDAEMRVFVQRRGAHTAW